MATNSPNNDNVGAGNKDNFSSHDVVFATAGFIDREYNVDNTNGTSEYRFEDHVRNNIGTDIVWFHWELGFGTGANFQRRGTPALDMDWPDKDPTPINFGASSFRVLNHQAYSIDWSAGLLSNGMQNTFFWNIDVCDYDPLNMPASARTATGYKFTLRLLPSSIPPPNQPNVEAVLAGVLLQSTSNNKMNSAFAAESSNAPAVALPVAAWITGSTPTAEGTLGPNYSSTPKLQGSPGGDAPEFLDAFWAGQETSSLPALANQVAGRLPNFAPNVRLSVLAAHDS
jgi:hypothetical protein